MTRVLPEDWRHRAKVASSCPFNATHGGCHYPECGHDCPGWPSKIPVGSRPLKNVESLEETIRGVEQLLGRKIKRPVR